ncbi:YT521-B-like domain-containing protein [Russula emetica]|nr:YT521-B-like domain-containing protein [Russula emetica]
MEHLTFYPSPLGYSTPPPFAYPPTSFVPVPSIYGSHYPHHNPSYQENQGAWWYLTPGTQSQFSLGHPSSVPQHEDERSGQTRTASPPYPSTLKESLSRSRSGDPSDPRTETRPPPLPSVSTSSLQTRTAETQTPSESGRDWQERRSYHPKTPAHRSEWVMWVGNVPSDATPDEFRAFFNRPLPPQSSSQSRESSNPPQVYGGVSSVFLIARSNCAFVNFESEAQLEAAVARFHGKPIRSDNPPCPRLVCRVRKRTDDLKAGVGVQRGNGMHVKWIKEQTKTAKGGEADLVGLDKAIGGLPSPLSISDDDGQGRSSTPCSSISGSLASTDSGILTRYFPQRYFILKSLTQHDLDLSVQRNIWATQQHNEEILDQAYRTSKDVFLIFGVNKSGEFYGYSRMAGRILHSKDRVPWASRPTSPVPLRPSTVSDVKGNVRSSPPTSIVQGYQDPHYVLFPEEYVVEQSPKSISPPQEEEPHGIAQVSSAPAELHNPHRRLSQSTQNTGPGLPHSIKSLPFELHADGPSRALRDRSGIPQAAHPSIPSPSGESKGTLEHSGDAALQTVAEELSDIDGPKEVLAEAWGRPFRVDWIRTDHLSFSRTKHLRNPWNHGREVKISRDGTELEPSIGRQLLEEWDKRPLPADIAASADSSRTVQQRHGSKTT